MSSVKLVAISGLGLNGRTDSTRMEHELFSASKLEYVILRTIIENPY